MDAEDNYTDEQYESLKTLLLELKAKHPNADVLGHRDLPRVNKACPCFDVKPWWETINQAVGEQPCSLS